MPGVASGIGRKETYRHPTQILAQSIGQDFRLAGQCRILGIDLLKGVKIGQGLLGRVPEAIDKRAIEPAGGNIDRVCV